jgi:hypothetical protein
MISNTDMTVRRKAQIPELSPTDAIITKKENN